MNSQKDKYVNYVEHPLYGKGPKLTGLNPDPLDRDVHLHWNAMSRDELRARYMAITGKPWPLDDYGFYNDRHIKRIDNTAIAAGPLCYEPTGAPPTHYFDTERQCVDCQRMFIFFAQEQKHWYEELCFTLESDCVRCVDCRKKQQGIARQRERYESLFHVKERTVAENMEMADCCLSLIEKEIFTIRQTERVRMLLNLIPKTDCVRESPEYENLVNRLLSVERHDGL